MTQTCNPSVPMLHRIASLSEIIPLRAAILRADLPLSYSHFPGDDAPTTRHFASIEHDVPIACLTMMQNAFKDQPGWQLRGMAVAPTHRGRHVGQELLAFAIATIQPLAPIALLWCNARTPAVGFYQKQGWRIVSEEFDIPTAGPHFRMSRNLPAVPPVVIPSPLKAISYGALIDPSWSDYWIIRTLTDEPAPGMGAPYSQADAISFLLACGRSPKTPINTAPTPADPALIERMYRWLDTHRG